MNIEIINKPLTLEIYGCSGTAVEKDYTGTAFKLMDRMWKIVKSQNIKNKGRNIWVYESGEKVFAGVEPEGEPIPETGLERKEITLEQYAYCKHIGPYSLIKQTGLAMKAELAKRGLESSLPYIEIYGHWTNDEAKLETELFMSVR